MERAISRIPQGIEGPYPSLAALMRGPTPWRNRIQSYDATFTLEPTEPLNLHFNSVPWSYPSLKAVSVFDDRTQYYDPANKLGSVKNPNTGTQIRIQSISAQDGFMQIEVRPAK
jgi:immune inhibitor A